MTATMGSCLHRFRQVSSTSQKRSTDKCVASVVDCVVTKEDETEPATVIQLAVSKEGIVSGTLYNRESDTARSIQGQVDKETQRVAFRIADSDNIVMETGLYNLTQEESPVMVHYGDDDIRYYLFVRLENPEESN